MFVLNLGDTRLQKKRNTLRSTYTHVLSRLTILNTFIVLLLRYLNKPYILAVCPSQTRTLTPRTCLVRIETSLAGTTYRTYLRTLNALHIRAVTPEYLAYRIGTLIKDTTLLWRYHSAHNSANLIIMQHYATKVAIRFHIIPNPVPLPPLPLPIHIYYNSRTILVPFS